LQADQVSLPIATAVGEALLVVVPHHLHQRVVYHLVCEDGCRDSAGDGFRRSFRL